MPNYTKEDNIKDILDYIHLDLNNIPEFLKNFKPLDFRCSKTYIDNEYKIYQYIPINKIEILITTKNRLEDMKEKYAEAKPIGVYINPQKNEDMPYHAIFLDMLRKVELEKIEKIANIQNQLQKEPPFFIKYSKSYEWQIYYAENTDTYFMLVPSQEAEYECLFYLLKMQIEYYNKKQVPYIFAPVNYIEYSGEILKKSEITELENFLWLFTKEWATTYEVANQERKNSIHIVGETWVYEGVKSKYKIILNSREEALRFYKKIKAMFILQTEIPHYYQFKTKINNNSELEFYYKDIKMEYSYLTEFLKKEYGYVEKQIKDNTKKLEVKREEIQKIKQKVTQKEQEYANKQRQIATYLEYRKTFLGKVKYYFKFKKAKVKETFEEKQEEKKQEQKKLLEEKEKEFYTIEDLVTIYTTLEKQIKEMNNIELDEIAAKNKLKNMEKKIENAILYIQEIDNHKKSIFEFWKFASKDELATLEAGEEVEKIEQKKLKKIFDYQTDLEELGIQADRMQREKLSKKEQDSIYLANTAILRDINRAKRQLEKKEYEQEDQEQYEKSLQEQKNDKKSDTSYYSVDNFNLFGSITEEMNKVKTLGNKKHREVEKEKFKILELTDKTSVSEWKNTIKNTASYISEAMDKIKSIYDMKIYVTQDEIKMQEYSMANIDPESALKIEVNEGRKKEKLHVLKIKEGMPILYYTNIIYYDNYNKTLPLGMNISDKVLIDTNKFEFKIISDEEVNTNMYHLETEELQKPKVTSIHVYEYEVELKENKKE